MIEINFKYQKKNNFIKCKENDIISDICEQFKNKIKINRISFIYEGMKINLESKMTVKDLFQLNNKKKKKKCEINVISDLIIIQFSYSGTETFLKINEDDKVEDILKRFTEKAKMDFNTVYFLYKGEIITEEKYNSTFDNFASKIDNQANTASIIVYDVDH